MSGYCLPKTANLTIVSKVNISTNSTMFVKHILKYFSIYWFILLMKNKFLRAIFKEIKI